MEYYDLMVLGGGSGGLGVARAAARIGARVALVEKGRLGGECTNTACVPSKALIRAAKVAHEVRRAGQYGIRVPDVTVDFPAVMDRVRAVVSDFTGSGTGEGLRQQGIAVYFGSPAFEAYDTIVLEAEDGSRRRIHGARFVIATGSRAAVPPIDGLVEAGYLDNQTIWDLQERPASLVVIGGGPVGLEFGQALARLGTEVTILDSADRILSHEEPEVTNCLTGLLAAEGITIRTGVEITGVTRQGSDRVVRFRAGDDAPEQQAVASHVLVAAGRWANVEGLNLQALGIQADRETGIEVDDALRTRAPNVFAVGDVLGHHQWTHAAGREADVVVQNALFGLSRKVDYRAVPWATFTDPEVATVGLSEAEARRQDPMARVFRAGFDEVARPRIDGQPQGFARVVVGRSGTILGATVIGVEASGILQEFVLAMEHGLTLADIDQTVHPYPTYSGLAQTLASQFRRTRLEKGYVRNLLRWVYGYSPGAAAQADASDDHAGPSVEPIREATHHLGSMGGRSG